MHQLHSHDPGAHALDTRYRDSGLTIVGVHSPEFAFERGADNVGAAIHTSAIRYPAAQDNAFKTWEAWGNLYLAGVVPDRRARPGALPPQR